MKAAFLLLAAVAAHAACVISGTVRDAESGKTLSGAHVYAKPLRADYSTAAGGGALQIGRIGIVLGEKPAILRTSNEQGAFCFEDLTPATYNVLAEHAGYLITTYGGRAKGDDGIRFEVADGTEVPPIAIRMLAGATLGGMVFDPEGSPVAGAQVGLSRKVWGKGWTENAAAETASDANGAFRFSMLAPGTYYLSVEEDSFEDRSRTTLDAHGKPANRKTTETFYSGSYTFAHATPIPLKAGEENTRLVMTMLPPGSRHFSGTLVKAELLLTPFARLNLQIEDGIGGNIEIPIGPDGAFSADGLAPAKYQFSLNNAEGMSGNVDLTTGDVNGFVIEPDRELNLAVAVRTEGRDSAAGVPVALIDRETAENCVSERDGPGRFYFSALSPGIYRIEAAEDGHYVKSLRIGGQVQKDTWFDLRQSAPENVEVLIGSRMASMEGHLDLHQGDTHGLAVTVLAVDETRSGAQVQYEDAVAGHTGKFSFDSLAPGKWRLLAVEGFDEGPWGSPELAEALHEKSVAVELGEGQKKNIAAPVISPEEWEAALRKVGM